MSEPIKRKCPSCGYEMLGGKYCPQCRAELVDTETVKPSDAWLNELVEKTAKRTAELLSTKPPEAEPPAPAPAPGPAPVSDPVKETKANDGKKGIFFKG